MFEDKLVFGDNYLFIINNSHAHFVWSHFNCRLLTLLKKSCLCQFIHQYKCTVMCMDGYVHSWTGPFLPFYWPVSYVHKWQAPPKGEEVDEVAIILPAFVLPSIGIALFNIFSNSLQLYFLLFSPTLHCIASIIAIANIPIVRSDSQETQSVPII